MDAGKHVFCEKPAGMDVPGVKMAMAACEAAAKKNLSLVSGCAGATTWASARAIKRILDGQIGEIIAIQENYLRGPYVLRERKPEWNEMQYQFQNWYHFNWLSGDDFAQSLIHNITVTSWVIGDISSAEGLGHGRAANLRRTEVRRRVRPSGGRVRVSQRHADFRLLPRHPRLLQRHHRHHPRHQGPRVHAVASRTSKAKSRGITAATTPSMYDVEHKELFEAIRAGKPLNNGKYMCICTLLAIMGQLAAYTGQQITWDRLMKSKLSYALPRYGWDVEPPVKPGANGQYPTAMPGLTQFR